MDDLPTTQFEAFKEVGAQPLKLMSAEMGVSKNSGKEQMTVVFETQGGAKIFEFYQISDSTFMMYKLRRLVEATGIQLGSAEVNLKDIAKILPRGAVIAGMVQSNDRGYGEIDYSTRNGGFGLYKYNELFSQAEPAPQAPGVPAPAPAPAPSQEPILDINTDDLPFNQPVGAQTTVQQEQPKLDSELAKNVEILSEDAF